MQNSKEQHGILRGTSESNDPKILTLNKEDSFKPIVHPIEGLPFGAAQTEPETYQIIFGKYLLSDEKFKSLEAVKEKLKSTDWLMILNLIGIYVDYNNNNK